MEEEKAAAYYDELTRKGGGAARFKQGLGFSTSAPGNDAVPTKQISSSSFLNNFVKASSPTTTSNLQKQSELQSIQNKLKKKHAKEEEAHSSRVDRDRERDHEDRDRERNRDYREKDYRHRERGREYRDRDRERDRGRDCRDRDRERRRRRSMSPRERREEKKTRKERSDKVDYSRLIEGYDKMTPAERVKAKMKLQLAETAEKDETKGMGSGWERFEFDKDAPLDDEELEAAEDDVALVKHIGQSFRFSAIEARREEQVKAAHDEAMFGAPAVPPSISSDSEPEADNSEKKSNEGGLATSLLSEKVLAKQEGSWRDRARKG